MHTPAPTYTARSQSLFKIIIRYESGVQKIVKHGCDLCNTKSLDAGRHAVNKKSENLFENQTDEKRKKGKKERSLAWA